MFGNLHDLVQSLHEALRRVEGTLAVAESCTGGILGGAITSVPGSSDVFVGGVIAYSNRIKERVLSVPAEVLTNKGAVSEPSARFMAQGVMAFMEASMGLSITGVAGPGGGSVVKPVGTVYVGCSNARSTLVSRYQFEGTRHRIRWLSVKCAVEFAQSRLTP